MKTRIPTQVKPQNQQGFILVLALLLMLFVGTAIISGIDRTGTETRIAQSRVMAASIQAAAEAGIFTLRSEAGNAEHANADLSASCEYFIEAVEGDYSDPQNFMDEPEIWWHLDETKSDTQIECSELEQGDSIFMAVQAWQGSEDQQSMVSQVGMGITITFDLIPENGQNGGGNDSPHGNKTAGEVLNETFGEDAARAIGDITTTGNANIFGDVALGGQLSEGGRPGVGVQGSSGTYGGASDPFNLEAIIDHMNLKDLPLSNPSIDSFNVEPGSLKNENGVEVVGSGQFETKTFLGEEYHAVRLNELDVGGTNTATGNVLLFVDGDLDLSNRTTFRMANDSSLVLIVSGAINFGNFFSTEPQVPVNNTGLPTFALMTTTSDKVSLGRLDDMYGMIYAANAEVDIGAAGSRFTGQIFADEITLRANNSVITFQQAFDAEKLSNLSAGDSSGDFVFGPSQDTNIDFEFF
ncbi:hypothetical protein SAMN05660443_0259 [Marinospirillum celere]|uniref:DUF7305 domain-containing protein n=1 Tax=Marinospirillum celere TaxID=1122252 RepID=A0A1I1E1D0_9GAMM|nr:hypothetical protein [Marinospirillum celere]SFB80874.1 hypothetical protein SAMN05660443_0259 [Marinospirillum celere]